MKTNVLHIDPCGQAVCAVRLSLTERRLRRFHGKYQAAVRALAGRHSRLADLAVSFPAMLFALAAPRRGFHPAPVAALAVDGASLGSLAAAARLPLWTRKLPPEAFDRPLPPLPDSESFRRCVGNHLPTSTKWASKWLDAVARAAEWGDEAFAVWTAREVVRDPKSFDLKVLRIMALWAWWSLRPGTRGHDFVEQRWTPGMRFAQASSAADVFKTRMSLFVMLGDEALSNLWAKPGRAGGYDFTPIHSARAVYEEALAMENCLRGYASDLALNHGRLWSVRKDGERVATLRLARRYSDPLPVIVELRLAKNKDAPVEVWKAAREWLQANIEPDVNIRPVGRYDWVLRRAAWVEFWRPYWLARRRIPDWAPLRPSWPIFYAL